ncbi:MAG: hypothetical protein LBD37_03115 [Treponema sp.]|jgi:hypothetical protein|nr:hypothetical protein [Treponema sp.]
MKIGQALELHSSGFSSYEACLSLLTQEQEYLEAVAGLQRLAREAAVARDWHEFETLLGCLERMGGEFEVLDQERTRVFALLGGGSREWAPDGDEVGRPGAGAMPEEYSQAEQRGFYALIAAFPDAQRRAAAEVYRRLKEECLRIRLANVSLLGYLREARAVAEGFLSAVFPARKHTTYSRRGRQVEADARCMILNQEC